MSKYKTGDRFEIQLGREVSPGTFEVIGTPKRLNNYHLDNLKQIGSGRVPEEYKEGIMQRFTEGISMRNMDVLMESLVRNYCPCDFFKESKELKEYIDKHCVTTKGCRDCWLGWVEKEVGK